MSNDNAPEPRSLHLNVTLLNTGLDHTVNEVLVPFHDRDHLHECLHGFRADAVAIVHYWRIGAVVVTTSARIDNADALDEDELHTRFLDAIEAVNVPPSTIPAQPVDVLPASGSHLAAQLRFISAHLKAIEDIVDNESAFLRAHDYSSAAMNYEDGVELLRERAKSIRDRGLDKNPDEPDNAVN